MARLIRVGLLRLDCRFLALVFFGLSAIATADDRSAPTAPSASLKVELPDGAGRLDERQLAGAIDKYFESRWRQQGIAPAAPASDAEFLRRAYLNLTGKIPPASEVRAYLANSAADKDSVVVESLLKQGACATHFANVWREILLGAAADNLQSRALASRLETWLKLRFTANMPYDQIVRELLVASPGDQAPQQILLEAMPDASAFYQAAEQKPELLAAAASRVFLGLQVQCAQCHDHPHAHWKQKEFWSFAAFFSDLQQNAMAESASGGTPPSLKIPDTEIVAQAAFLDGSAYGSTGKASRRIALVSWVTSAENQWFASAVVNRFWEQMLGRGLIDPVDDLEAAGPNDHRELLTFVSGQFRSHDYDLRYLLRAISATRLYHLSSATDSANRLDRHHFARIPVRRMTAEQLFESLIEASGLRETPPARNQINDLDSMRGDFQQKFAEANIARTEAETSILQALSLMNGKLVGDAIDLKQGATLVAVNEAPFMNTAAKIETLFLATLSRVPEADESRSFVEYIEKQEAGAKRAQALADVYWALLNSAEFEMVH